MLGAEDFSGPRVKRNSRHVEVCGSLGILCVCVCGGGWRIGGRGAGGRE